jgi:hypothetical protein
MVPVIFEVINALFLYLLCLNSVEVFGMRFQTKTCITASKAAIVKYSVSKYKHNPDYGGYFLLAFIILIWAAAALISVNAAP